MARQRRAALSVAKEIGIRIYDVKTFLSQDDEVQEVQNNDLKKVLEQGASEEWLENKRGMARELLCVVETLGGGGPVRGTLTSALKQMLGTISRRQLDWFEESIHQLKLIL